MCECHYSLVLTLSLRICLSWLFPFPFFLSSSAASGKVGSLLLSLSQVKAPHPPLACPPLQAGRLSPEHSHLPPPRLEGSLAEIGLLPLLSAPHGPRSGFSTQLFTILCHFLAGRGLFISPLQMLKPEKKTTQNPGRHTKLSLKLSFLERLK